MSIIFGTLSVLIAQVKSKKWEWQIHLLWKLWFLKDLLLIHCDIRHIKELNLLSMVTIAAFGLGDPITNPGWFAVSNSNQKLSGMNNTINYSSIGMSLYYYYRNPEMWGILVGIDKYIPKL